MSGMTVEKAAELRAPFPPEMIGKLPRAGIELDYVGHAAVTDRLLQVDPEWSWEPVAWAENGTPLISLHDTNAVLWIRLTVCGVTRLGVGIVAAKAFELQKQLISDALRNGAMRFGVALDLWSKEGLHAEAALPSAEPTAAKKDVDLFKSCIDELEDDQRSEFLAWKAAQDFAWPWTVAALEAMEKKLEEIVGAGVPQSEARPGTAAAPAPTESDPGEPSSLSDGSADGAADAPDAAPASPGPDLLAFDDGPM